MAKNVESKGGLRVVLFNNRIFRAELYAISLALNIIFIHRCKDKDFIIFSDSMSSLQALSGFRHDKKVTILYDSENFAIDQTRLVVRLQCHIVRIIIVINVVC